MGSLQQIAVNIIYLKQTLWIYRKSTLARRKWSSEGGSINGKSISLSVWFFVVTANKKSGFCNDKRNNFIKSLETENKLIKNRRKCVGGKEKEKKET